MKYRKIILIIIMISLGQILLSYIENTSRTHARTHARTHTHAHTRAHAHTTTTIAVQVAAVRWVGEPNHDEVNSPFIQINSRLSDVVFAIVLVFFAFKQIIGRPETRTRDRMCFQSIRTV